MTRRRVLVIVPALLLALALATSLQAADKVLPLVPSDALGFGVVHNLAQVDAKLQKLGQQLHAPIPSLLTQLRATTGIQKGLDEKGNAALIVLPNEGSGDEPVPVLLVPVSDYRQFIDQLSPDKPGEKVTGVTFMGASFIAGSRGQFAALTEPKYRKSLEKVLGSNQGVNMDALQPWLSETDAAMVMTSSGLKLVSSKVQEQLRNLKETMGGLGPEMASAVAAMDIYSQIIQAAEKELSTLAVGVQANPQGDIHLCKRGLLNPAGQVARALSQAMPAEGNLLAGLPGGPFVFAFGGVTPEPLMQAAMQFGMTFMKQNHELYGMSPEQVDKMAKVSTETIKRMRGMSLVMKPGKGNQPIYSNILEIVRVDNAPQYMAESEKQMAAMNELLKEAKDSLMKPMKLTKVEIGGKPGLQLEMTMPQPKAAMPIPNYEQMMEKLMGPGGKITTYLVPADEHMVVLGLNTAKDMVVTAIEAAKTPSAGLAAEADVAKTAALLPAGAQWVGYISPRGAVSFVARTIAAFAPEGVVPPIPPFPATPAVGIALKALPDQVQAEIVLPSAMLEGVGAYVDKLQQGEKPEIP